MCLTKQSQKKALATHEINEISQWDMDKVNDWFRNQGLPM